MRLLSLSSPTPEGAPGTAHPGVLGSEPSGDIDMGLTLGHGSPRPGRIPLQAVQPPSLLSAVSHYMTDEQQLEA